MMPLSPPSCSYTSNVVSSKPLPHMSYVMSSMSLPQKSSPALLGTMKSFIFSNQLGCQPSSILDLVAPSPHRIDSQFFPVFLQSCPPFTFPIFDLSHYPPPREILFSPSRTMIDPPSAYHRPLTSYDLSLLLSLRRAAAASRTSRLQSRSRLYRTIAFAFAVG